MVHADSLLGNANSGGDQQTSNTEKRDQAIAIPEHYLFRIRNAIGNYRIIEINWRRENAVKVR